MGTRSWVSIALEPKDQNTIKKFTPETLGRPLDIHSSWNGIAIPEIRVKTHVSCYFQLDGDPSFMGAMLLQDFGTYDKALNLCLGGCYQAPKACRCEETGKAYADDNPHIGGHFLSYSKFYKEDGKTVEANIVDCWNDSQPWFPESDNDCNPDNVFTGKNGTEDWHMINWCYLFHDGKWYYARTTCKRALKWQRLTRKVCGLD